MSNSKCVNIKTFEVKEYDWKKGLPSSEWLEFTPIENILSWEGVDTINGDGENFTPEEFYQECKRVEEKLKKNRKNPESIFKLSFGVEFEGEYEANSVVSIHECLVQTPEEYVKDYLYRKDELKRNLENQLKRVQAELNRFMDGEIKA